MPDTDPDTNWYGPDVATFGDRVAAAREAAGMTQSVLARRIGVRVATLRHWENDVSEPRANRLSMLAGLLNVSMMWLINGEGDGLDAPDAATELPVGAADVLPEMALVRKEMSQGAKRLGVLEKRLRALLREPSDD
ncbi:helix-turn-helix transcriptional regulator [Sulfitobacter albidus]|uniref:Helix-turn-helix transcriptional regulator n=1 Tax=Sulfitobacter albidus TaxID=2829501 RepID=A0A975JF65_9RHOB|nr:helix-turn-helix transcriptional regulator [Sulfitobacter albidus]QUJ77096.1 helix-turn-helix transcriptional regulator [Sulfitobacter albidus]